MSSLKFRLACALSALATFSAAHAGTTCVSLTTLGSGYTQNFDTLSNTAASTTNPLTITGWFQNETGGGARDNEQYAVDTGGSNTGDTFSYGSAAATDRALGGLQSGTLIPVIGACFTNNTGTTVASLDISYTGEQWRIANIVAARDDRLDFQFSTDASSLTTGAWTDVNGLDFTNPVKTAAAASALDGNNATNRTSVSSSVTSQSIANGATFWIRWNDLNASGADDGLAVDDFSLIPQGAAAPPPNLSIDNVSLNEGNAGTTAFTFTVSLDAPAPVGGVTFDITTANDTAITGGVAAAGGADFVAQSLTSQTIPATQQSYAFTVNVNGDTVFEPNTQQFFVNVANVTGATVTDAQGQGTINDDDSFPALSAPAAASGFEGDSGNTNIGILYSLSNSADQDITVIVSTADGTATLANVDYLQLSNTSFMILAGQTSRTYFAQTVGDDFVEPDETFTVSVDSYDVGQPPRAPGGIQVPPPTVVTITNDDALPLAFRIDNVTVTETDAAGLTADFTVTLATVMPPRAPDGTTIASVQYTTVAGTASAADFTATSGTLNFGAAGTQTISVPITGDLLTEATETFTVVLSNPIGATIADDTGLGTINDDDASADLSVTITDTPDPVLPGGLLTYTVTLTNSGPSNADNASFSLPLPTETTFNSLTQPGGWNCTTPAVGTNGTVSCNDSNFRALVSKSLTPEKLAPGSAVFTIVVTVDALATPGKLLNADVTASSTTFDPTPANNATTGSTTIGGSIVVPTAPIPTLDRLGQLLAALMLMAVAALALRQRAI